MRCDERRRKLVAAEIIRADHDGESAERRTDAAVVLRLLVLGGHCRAAGHQELGAQEPDAFRAVTYCDLHLFREIDVALQRDRSAVRRKRRLRRDTLELQIEPMPPHRLQSGHLELVGRRIEQDLARLSVEQHDRPVGDPVHRARNAHAAGIQANAPGSRRATSAFPLR